MPNNTIYIKNVRQAKNSFEKSRGLIGAKKPYPLLLKTRYGIHTFGMQFPIDVVILGKDNNVVKIKEALKPNKVFFWNPKYEKVLELPANFIRKEKIVLGMKIEH